MTDLTDPNKKRAIVLARTKLHGMERSDIWRAAIQNGPEDRRLVTELAQPFMNFKEARITLGKVLGIDPLKIQFMAFKGQRTFYPDDVQFMQCTEPGTEADRKTKTRRAGQKAPKLTPLEAESARRQERLMSDLATR